MLYSFFFRPFVVYLSSAALGDARAPTGACAVDNNDKPEVAGDRTVSRVPTSPDRVALIARSRERTVILSRGIDFD